MYTVEIGRQFLELYNKKTGADYSALDFFEEEFFPTVFDAEDQKQLFPFIHNSAFNQNSYPRLAEEEGIKVSEYRKQRFYEDLELIPKGEKSLSHSALIGAKSGSLFDIPSGQVSDIDFDISKDDIIYSWIGGALSLSIKGGYDILIKDDELNWYLFLGWKYYRNFLQHVENAKGRQLPEWNSCWVVYGAEYKEDLDRTFSEVLAGISKDNARSKNIRIRKLEWTNLIFGISRFFKKRHRVLAYAYKFQFGQNFNRTLGFFPIQFHEINKWYELLDNHLESNPKISGEGWRALEDIYESHYRFEDACLQVGIGLRALKPKDLEKYTAGSMRGKADKVPKMSSKEGKIQFLIYQTWLIAMLNKEEILELTKKLAEILHKYSMSDERGKTAKSRKVQELWKKKSLASFIDLLTEIMKESGEKEVFTEIVDKIVLELPEDRFKLFITLAKFNYNSY